MAGASAAPKNALTLDTTQRAKHLLPLLLMIFAEQLLSKNFVKFPMWVVGFFFFLSSNLWV